MKHNSLREGILQISQFVRAASLHIPRIYDKPCRISVVVAVHPDAINMGVEVRASI